MGRDPSGSAGTGQAKMGSRARRGEGQQSGSALWLRQGGVGVHSPARARLRAPSPQLFTFGQTPLQQKSLRPPPLTTTTLPPSPEAFTTWPSRITKRGPEG